MYKVLISFLFLVIVSCKGDVGPTGPQGPQGIQGEEGPPGPSSRNITVERRLTAGTYDSDGDIIIQDSRISPFNYRGCFIRLDFGNNQVVHLPIAEFIILYTSIAPEENEGQTPLVYVSSGAVLIEDPQRLLLTLSQVAEGATPYIAILITG